MNKIKVGVIGTGFIGPAHVICEKPLSINVAEAQELIELADKKNWLMLSISTFGTIL